MEKEIIYMVNFLGHIEIWDNEEDFLNAKKCDVYIDDPVEVKVKLKELHNDETENLDLQQYVETISG